jgi:hypothetical protein
VRQRIRVLTTEAARLRVEPRNWDVASPHWIDHVNGRLGQLATKIDGMRLASDAAETPAADAPTIGLEPITPADNPIERRVYDYLYPRPGVSPAFS